MQKLLKGVTAIVTRPQPYNQELSGLLMSLGCHVYSLPFLRIQPLSFLSYDNKCYDVLIYISRYAACLGRDILNKHKGTCYAIGSGTASELVKQYDNVLWSSTFNSYGLLALKELQHSMIAKKQILIIKGQNGLSVLKDTLVGRGALVDTIDVYKRSSIVYPENTINKIVLTKKMVSILITSEQILQCLLNQLYTFLRNQVTLLVPGKRIELLAKKNGFENIINTENANYQSVIKGLTMIKQKYAVDKINMCVKNIKDYSLF